MGTHEKREVVFIAVVINTPPGVSNLRRTNLDPHSDILAPTMLSLAALAFTPPTTLLAPHSVAASNAPRAGLSMMAQPMVSRRAAALNLLGAAGVLGAAGAAGAGEPPQAALARLVAGDTVKAAEDRAAASKAKKQQDERDKEEMQEKLAAAKAARKAAKEALPKR